MDNVLICDMSADIMPSPSSSVDPSASMAMRRSHERELDVLRAAGMTGSAPSWTQVPVGLHHGHVISVISASSHESMCLNAVLSGSSSFEQQGLVAYLTGSTPAGAAVAAPYYWDNRASTPTYYSKRKLLHRVYKLSASAELPVVPTPDHLPSDLEYGPSRWSVTSSGYFDPTSGSYRNSTVYSPATFEINVPDRGKIRDVKVWLELVHDHRGGPWPSKRLDDRSGQDPSGTFNFGGSGSCWPEEEYNVDGNWGSPLDYRVGLGGLVIALRSPNTNFRSAHPLWNSPQLAGLVERHIDGAFSSLVRGCGRESFGNCVPASASLYLSMPEIYRNSYLLWAGQHSDPGIYPSLYERMLSLQQAVLEPFLPQDQDVYPLSAARLEHSGSSEEAVFFPYTGTPTALIPAMTSFSKTPFEKSKIVFYGTNTDDLRCVTSSSIDGWDGTETTVDGGYSSTTKSRMLSFVDSERINLYQIFNGISCSHYYRNYGSDTWYNDAFGIGTTAMSTIAFIFFQDARWLVERTGNDTRVHSLFSDVYSNTFKIIHFMSSSVDGASVDTSFTGRCKLYPLGTLIEDAAINNSGSIFVITHEHVYTNDTVIYRSSSTDGWRVEKSLPSLSGTQCMAYDSKSDTLHVISVTVDMTGTIEAAGEYYTRHSYDVTHYTSSSIDGWSEEDITDSFMSSGEKVALRHYSDAVWKLPFVRMAIYGGEPIVFFAKLREVGSICSLRKMHDKWVFDSLSIDEFCSKTYVCGDTTSSLRDSYGDTLIDVNSLSARQYGYYNDLISVLDVDEEDERITLLVTTSDDKYKLISYDMSDRIIDGESFSFDNDIDMRTIFSDSSQNINPRNFIAARSSRIDQYNAGKYNSPTFNTKRIFDELTRIITVDRSGTFFPYVMSNGRISYALTGANVPWMADPRVPEGSLFAELSKELNADSYIGRQSTDVPPSGGWLSCMSGYDPVPDVNEFPTWGRQVGPNDIQPLYPLLDDVYSRFSYAQVSYDTSLPGPLPGNVNNLVGFRPGLRGTECSGTWKIMIANAHEFHYPNSGSVSDELWTLRGGRKYGYWFRQARIELLIEQDEGIELQNPAHRLTYARSGSPRRPGSRTVSITSGNVWFDAGETSTSVIDVQEHGRSVGITDREDVNMFDEAVFTRLSGAWADSLPKDSPYFAMYLGNEFGTPHIPLAAGSGNISNMIDPNAGIDASLARAVIDSVITPKTTIHPDNVLKSYLNRTDYVTSTRDIVTNILSGNV